MLAVLTLAITLCLSLHLCSGASWVNSTNGFHQFLTFDSHIRPTDVPSVAPTVDFVWGASSGTVKAFSQAHNGVILSFYMPFSRDPDASHNLTFWQTHYPTFVLYECDRKTPVQWDGDTNIGLDISNPDVIKWQFAYALTAAREGYNAIAADNYDTETSHGGCGVYDASGQWVQKFSGKRGDPVFRKAAVEWLEGFKTLLHTEGLLLIPNFSLAGLSASDPTVLAIGNATDGILSEAGFTQWGNRLMPESEWLQIITFMRNLQLDGKGYFSINEWGKDVSDITPDVREWCIASWMLGNHGSSALFLSTIQGYGGASTFPEYGPAAGIGSPIGPMTTTRITPSASLYSRPYSTAFAVVNPSSTSSHISLNTSLSYTRLNGTAVATNAPLPVPASSAVVLLTTPHHSDT